MSHGRSDQARLEYAVTTSTERRLRLQISVHESWARTEDRSARTHNARMAAWDRFEKQVDPERKLPPALRAKMAENARTAHFKKMALKSVESRRRRRAGVGA
jgi:hypothetical protein